MIHNEKLEGDLGGFLVHYFMLLPALFLLCISSAIVAARPDISYIVEADIVKAREKFSLVRRYIGTIKAEKFSILNSTISGTVDKIHITPGQRVKKGQLLLKISAGSGRDKNLAILKQDLERSRSLAQSRDISASEFGKMQRELNEAQTDLEITSPFDGIVGVPRVVIGEFVSPGTSLVSVIDAPYSIYINIPASRLHEVKSGQTVRLKSGITTTISAVEMSIDPTTRTGFAKAILANCTNCIVGDSVFADVVVMEKSQAILLSKNAIFYKNQKPYVLAVIKDSDGKAISSVREVRLGDEQEGEIIIESGVSDGDEIISINPKRVPDKSKISVVK